MGVVESEKFKYHLWKGTRLGLRYRSSESERSKKREEEAERLSWRNMMTVEIWLDSADGSWWAVHLKIGR